MAKTKQCAVCLQTFESRRGLVGHALETGHGAELCCGRCVRLFGSAKGLEDHNRSAVHSESQGGDGEGQALMLSADEKAKATKKKKKKKPVGAGKVSSGDNGGGNEVEGDGVWDEEITLDDVDWVGGMDLSLDRGGGVDEREDYEVPVQNHGDYYRGAFDVLSGGSGRFWF